MWEEIAEVFMLHLVLLSFFSRRFWCTTICPLGALYGLIATFGVFRLHIRECSGCAHCNICPMKAAQYKTKTILLHQCILCSEFEALCPVDGFVYSPITIGREHVPDETRRMILKQGGLIAGGVLAGSLFSILDSEVMPLSRAYQDTSGLLRFQLCTPLQVLQ